MKKKKFKKLLVGPKKDNTKKFEYDCMEFERRFNSKKTFIYYLCMLIVLGISFIFLK